MKNITKILIVLSVAVFSIFVLASCDNNKEQNDKKTFVDSSAIDISNPNLADDGLPVFNVYAIDNIAEYTLVRSEFASDEVKDAFSELRSLISDVCGEQIQPVTDYNKAKQYEILIGDTSRPESKNIVLEEKQYVIKMVGDKIVIKGGSDAALAKAIEQFKFYFVGTDTVYVPEKGGVYYSQDYMYDSIKIDGKDISEFKIYAVKKKCADGLRENIDMKYSGQKVEVVTEMTENNGPYIILDASSTDYTSYKAEVVDGNLKVTGSFRSCMDFLDHFADKKGKAIDIKENIEGDIASLVLFTKKQLMEVMKTVYDSENIIIGQQVNLGDERPSDTIKMFETATGEAPGIIAYDLACYGLQLPTAAPEDISQTLCELIEFAEKGGIVSLASHFANPTGNWGDQAMVRGQLGGEKAWEELLTPGTELYNTLMEEIVIDGEFLKTLSDIGLPIIWRPFHEMNSGWFWYGIAESGKTIDAEYFVRLWKMLYEKYEEMGIDNLIWNYSPNNDSGWIDVMYCYPGDEYVDMVGLDWYTSGGYEIANSSNSYAKLMATDMITNINEFGISSPLEAPTRLEQPQTFNAMDFASLIEQVTDDGHKICYILTWTAADSIGWWGKGDEMMSTGIFIGQEDLFKMLYSQK